MTLYLALGDSITAGYGVGNAMSFPSVYANFLRRHNPNLRLCNLGINGLTTKGLLILLQNNHSFRQAVSQASLITVTIGANDLLHFIRNNNLQTNAFQLPRVFNNMNNNLRHLGEAVRYLNPMVEVKMGTLYNPLPAGPYAQYAPFAQEVLDKANTLIVACTKGSGFEVVYVDRVLRGKERLLLGSDLVHPNFLGHQAIAKAFARS